MKFQERKIEEMQVNPFQLIGKEWMLITAGTEEKANTMTASWGGMGVFWGKNVITTYIRPQRYTKRFIDTNDTFSVSFFSEEYKKILAYCGKVSGKDEDKIKNAKLSTCFYEGTPYFEEAKLVFICRKMCEGEIKPELFIDKEADEKWYPQKDYHRMYMGTGRSVALPPQSTRTSISSFMPARLST